LKKGKKGKPRFPRFFSLDKIFSTFSLSRAPFSAFSRGFLPKKKEGEAKQKWVGLLLRARA
jgi:hypothetical protein